ncbi:hypothetical protein [Lacinutrix sp. Bg11-31]|uniref:hypothetical protein n=1 Tax=Lacinutrix sp. Bg11-31 TaxID=2057808 RepID=UPI000C31238E|nr:hypothetical protein [Lacinutrix sp. Bg11-31]AUC83604.1 hypothetical protein CW733_16305 [Lacinutrix sp. Bg11-31]
MKTIKSTISKTKYVVLALIVAFSFSCSTEDGTAGPQGEQGITGANGADGTDGNANVEVLTFDMSAASGSFDDVTVPELTQDVIDNDVVLGYIKRGANWHPLPAVQDIIPFSVSVTIGVGFYALDYVDGGDGSSHSISAGDIDTLKIVIIESTSTSKTSNGKQQIYNTLNQAGIDINDFNAVTNYYNISK